MRWLRNRTTRKGGWWTVGMALTVFALAMGLAGLAAPPASAYGPGPPGYPTIQVLVTEGPGQIMGFGWGEDTAVTITRTRATVPTVPGTPTLGSPYPSMFQFFTSNGQVVRGDTITVTGNQSGYSRVLDVIDLDVDHFDVPDATLSGTKGSSSAGWGDLRTSLGNQFGGGGTQITVPADGSTTWSAVLPAADFELMEGVGASAWQTDPDGDTLQVARQVPNPMVRIDDMSVTVQGWWPGSTLDVYLDDDADHSGGWPFHYQVTVDGNGSFCCQPPPDPAWQFIEPGWVARVVGTFPTRDDGTVTKEVTYVQPPRPTTSAATLAGAVSGTLTDTTIGVGSLVLANGHCVGTTDTAVARLAYADPDYAVDFGSDVEQPWGWGTPCSSPIDYYDLIARDHDGDETHTPWYVDWMFDQGNPVVTVEQTLVDGEPFEVQGTGFDLTTIDVAQCELVGGDVGECDPSTLARRTTSPDFSGWPSTMAQFSEQYPAKRFLELSGGRVVDCAEADGACAVVATEVYRPEIAGYAPLTYEVPYWVDLAVTVAPSGTVSAVSGTATIRGTITASDSLWVHLTGELRQRLGRKVVAGWVDTWRFVEEPGVPTAFEVQVLPYNSLAFGSGSAEMNAWVDLGDDGPTDGASALQVVRLTLVKPAQPPKPPKPPKG